MNKLKFTSCLIVVALLLSFTQGISASDATMVKIDIRCTDSVSKQTFDGEATLKQVENEFLIDLKLPTDNKYVQISLFGDLYAFTTGHYAGKRLVGEFHTASSDITVDKVRFDMELPPGLDEEVVRPNKNDGVITIVLTDNIAIKQYMIQGVISSNEFSTINDLAVASIGDITLRDNISKDEYEEKMITLDLGVIPESKGNTITINSNDAPAQSGENRASKTSLSDFTYTQLNNFLTDAINSNGDRIYLSTYGIDSSFFSDLGWDNYDSSTGTMFSASKHVYQDASETGYYIGITMCDVILTDTYLSSGTNEASLSLRAKHRVILELLPGANYVQVFSTNAGPSYTDIVLTIGDIRGNTRNIFTESEASGKVNQISVDVITLISLIDELSFIGTLNSIFQVAETSDLNSGPVMFDDTVEAQIDRWGNVVRSIRLDGGSARISAGDQRLMLTGKYSYGNSCYYDWQYSYTSVSF